jgi:hypothetical protein
VPEDFYSFDKVLKELHLEEEQLKKLVSEGEIRAFRDDDKMKFKKEDIERFKHSKGSDLPTVEAPTEELTDELFGDDDLADDDVGMATQQIADSSFLEESVDEVAPIELESAPETPATTRRRTERTTTATTTTAKTRRRVEPEAVAEKEGTGMLVVLVAAAAVLLFGIIVAFNAAEVQSTAMTNGFASFMNDTFMK